MLDWLVLELFLLALIGFIVWVSRMKEDSSSRKGNALKFYNELYLGQLL